jgi:general secretion pathway protein K
VADLAWLGLDAATLGKLATLVTLLPEVTAVNLNTAPREVLVAAIDNLDLGTAERLVATRQSKPFRTLADVQALLPATTVPSPQRANVTSSFFEIRGRMRLDDRVLEERSMVERRNLDIVVLSRERQSQVLADRSQ